MWTGALQTLLAVGLMAALTLGLALLVGLERPWLQPWAVLRAAVQLGVLSLVLRGVIASLPLTVLLLGVMVVATTLTVGRRLRLRAVGLLAVAAVVAVAAAVPAAIVFATGAVRAEPRYLLAVVGILVGNAMTAATLMGRGLLTGLHGRRDEVEGMLALGATSRQATRSVVRHAASTAVLPATDQTRTTGIVTLPGAFVGAVFGGASPLLAAEFQLIVLAGVLLTGAVVVGGVGLVFGAPKTVPVDAPVLG